jgi:hypothetical protein
MIMPKRARRKRKTRKMMNRLAELLMQRTPAATRQMNDNYQADAQATGGGWLGRLFSGFGGMQRPMNQVPTNKPMPSPRPAPMPSAPSAPDQPYSQNLSNGAPAPAAPATGSWGGAPRTDRPDTSNSAQRFSNAVGENGGGQEGFDAMRKRMGQQGGIKGPWGNL